MTKSLPFINLLFLFLIALQGIAQSEKIDDLYLTIKNSDIDTVKGISYYNLAREYSHFDAEKALELVDSGQYYYTLAGDDLMVNESTYLDGVIQFRMGNLNKSLELILDYYNYTNRIGHDVKKTFALNMISKVYREKGDFKNAIFYLTEGLELNETLNLKRDVGFYATELGNLYGTLNQYDLAKEHFLKALYVAQELEFKIGEAISYRNLAENAVALKNYDESMDYLRQSITLDSISNYPIGLCRAHKNLGHIYELKKEYSTSNLYYDKSLSYIKGTDGNKKDYTDIYLGLSRNHVKLNLLDEANKYIAKAESYQDDKNNLEFNTSLNQLKYQYYEQSGQYKNAFGAMKSYVEAKDSVLNKDIANQITGSNIKYESEKKVREIEFLNIENENTKLKLTASIRRNLLLGGVLGLITIAGGIFALLFRKISKQNVIISNSLKEKNILLKEIHHRVKNNLQVVSSLLGLQGRYSNDPSIELAIRESKDRVRSMSLIHQKLYQQDSINTVNVNDYFKDLFNSLFDSYNIHPDKLKLKLNIDDIKLDVDSIIPIGLIVNELVSNALKHAFPDDREGEVAISFEEVDDQLRLTVQDNGVGMLKDFEETNGSFGYQLIKSFKSKLDADLEVNSVDGTKVSMIIRNYNKAA